MGEINHFCITNACMWDGLSLHLPLFNIFQVSVLLTPNVLLLEWVRYIKPWEWIDYRHVQCMYMCRVKAIEATPRAQTNLWDEKTRWASALIQGSVISCVRMRARAHTHTHTHTRTRAHARMHVRTCTHNECAWTHTWMHTYSQLHTLTQMCVHTLCTLYCCWFWLQIIHKC